MISHFFSLVKRKLCVKLSLKYYTIRIRNASNICQQLVHNKRRRRFKVRKIAQRLGFSLCQKVHAKIPFTMYMLEVSFLVGEDEVLDHDICNTITQKFISNLLTSLNSTHHKNLNNI